MELYLHAYLRFRGAPTDQIKARHHDLWHPEFALSLELDDATCQHLQSLSQEKLYVAVRYAGEAGPRPCPVSQMERTLKAIRSMDDRIPFEV